MAGAVPSVSFELISAVREVVSPSSAACASSDVDCTTSAVAINSNESNIPPSLVLVVLNLLQKAALFLLHLLQYY